MLEYSQIIIFSWSEVRSLFFFSFRNHNASKINSHVQGFIMNDVEKNI